MKKLLLVLFSATILHASAQKLVKNSVDEFTHDSTMETSKEKWFQTFSKTGFFYFRRVGQSRFFQLMYMDPAMKPVLIMKGAPLYVKFTDSSVIQLHAAADITSGRGNGARGFAGSEAKGFNIPYILTDDDLRQLQTHIVAKFRIYFSDSYDEYDVKDKFAATIRNAALLIK